MSLNLSQSQRQAQKQIQKLGQLQIQALKYLSMNSMDLRSEIFEEVQKNPALEISEDSMEDGDFSYSNNFEKLSDYTQSVKDSYSGAERSQAFQDILESNPDTSESLSEHLLFQFDMLNLPENQQILGEKLIHNLDKNGFHILAPVSFMNYDTDKDEDLKKCISIIQNLDPCGCCCQNVAESLLVQAKARGDAPEAALFILDGHLDMLNPPVAAKVLKKIHDYVKEEEKKEFNTNDYSSIKDFDEEDIRDGISFIQSLDPHPAGEYSPDENSFVIPDIKVTKIPKVKSQLEFEPDVISGEGEESHSFVVHSEKGILPEVSVSREYQQLLDMKEVSPEQKALMEKPLQDAKAFIESLIYRESSVYNAAIAIVNVQLEFFEKGPGHLVPLKQKDVAEILGVHETTVSRIANSKVLECEWGIFPFKYFFATGTSDESGSQEISKDKIIFEIKQILDSQAPGSKTLSDQKLSDMLSEKGIKVARRTVAKYRAQIGLKSSYDR